uniref:Uncharacterized protein n=1 Tax=Romanomermis culicivorax TaxID=13658 RepID=A0A915JGS9_ROMCU
MADTVIRSRDAAVRMRDAVIRKQRTAVQQELRDHILRRESTVTALATGLLKPAGLFCWFSFSPRGPWGNNTTNSYDNKTIN